MHFLRYFGLLISLLILLTQCNDSDDGIFTQAGVTTKVVDETVVIENNHGKPISYFAVEEETSYLIDWGPSSREENTIANGDSKAVPWDDIMSDGLLREGDRIIIYWWVAQDSLSASVEIKQNIVVL
ncbi:MAG: hypothetical protein WBA23_24265 [Tunicatimonas sp.]|uniref:hypothetical protein n=1 Tax=Tunicatimonas sp. TaxID=1940096 RepID=UPI003C76D09D